MQKQVTRNKSQAGFSLIELLVVVAIIGVLAAAGVVGYTSYLNGVKDDTQKLNVKTIASALQAEFNIKAGQLTGGICSTEGNNKWGATPADLTSSETGFTNVVKCVELIIANGKFKDAYAPGNGFAALENTSATDLKAACEPNKILVSFAVDPANASGPKQIQLRACAKANASSSDYADTPALGPNLIVTDAPATWAK